MTTVRRRRLGRRSWATVLLVGAFRKKREPCSFSATRVLIVGLVVVVVSGCGRYKQDLEEAKLRIDSLTADNKKCSEIVASLEKDKRHLTDERQAVDTKIDTLLKEIGDLKKTNVALSDELNKLKKKNSELSADLNSLRTGESRPVATN